MALSLHNKLAIRPTGTFLQSVEKALVVLELFGNERPTLTISEAASLAGMDRAGARRILLTLSELGFLQQSEKMFALTARVHSLGQRFVTSLPFWQVAQPVMEELASELNLTVSIGVADRQEVVYILRVPAKRLITQDPVVGSRIPIYASSIGVVVLAGMDQNAAESLVGSIEFVRHTENTFLDAKALLASIAQARRRGWCYLSEHFRHRTGGLAVPIASRTNNIIAGLHVSVPPHLQKSDPSAIAVQLQIAASKIRELTR